jgi:hypothetical protein
MKALVKVAVVLAGYIAAVMLADAAVAVRIANTSGPDAQASAGMYAFGDALLFLAVFSVGAIFPTGLALYFLRPYRWVWISLSIAGLAIAGTAIVSASIYILVAHLPLPRESPLSLCAAFAVLRMLLSPSLAVAFILAGLLAPSRASRWSLLTAAGSESVVAAYAAIHWFAGCCFI